MMMMMGRKESKQTKTIPDPQCMGESFQGYSWIQDFEADFP